MSSDSPTPQIKAEKASTTAPTSSSAAAKVAPEDGDADWDDDKPICELMVVYMKKRKAKLAAKEKAAAEAVAVKKAKASSGGGGNRVAAPQRKDAQYYQETKKGMLVQRLLVRWWYAYQWPKADDWSNTDVPSGYEELDGFPGVFVSMDVATLGTILDLRSEDMKPSLRNMSKKSAKEIQELCIAAYEGQMSALVEAEGEGVPLMQELRKELHQVRRIDTDAADAEAKNMSF